MSMMPEVLGAVATIGTVFAAPAALMHQDKIQGFFTRVLPSRRSYANDDMDYEQSPFRVTPVEKSPEPPFDWALGREIDFSHPAARPKLTLVRGIDRGLV